MEQVNMSLLLKFKRQFKCVYRTNLDMDECMSRLSKEYQRKIAGKYFPTYYDQKNGYIPSEVGSGRFPIAYKSFLYAEGNGTVIKQFVNFFDAQFWFIIFAVLFVIGLVSDFYYGHFPIGTIFGLLIFVIGSIAKFTYLSFYNNAQWEYLHEVLECEYADE
jgi:hypothetical protein